MGKVLEDYFSQDRIVTLLCRKRIASSQLTRRRNFFKNACGVSPGKPQRPLGGDVMPQDLLPPRRRWPRPRKERREDPKSDLPSAQAHELAKYVQSRLRLPASPKEYQWLQNLRLFIAGVQARALNCEVGDLCSYSVLRITAKKGKDFSKGCRIIAIYSLSDTLVASGFAAYLRDKIDDFLDKDSLAFRSVRDGKLPTHHDAIDRIYDFHANLGEAPLHIAECDIRGFFDSVSHSVIRRELAAFLSKSGLKLDVRLHHFIENFLTGYSYTETAIPAAEDEMRAKGIGDYLIFDPKDALSKRGIQPDKSHGIPQGSAMSCILANIILSKADSDVREIVGPAGNPEGFYLRYCDDIVIAHKIPEQCDRAKDAYTKRLDELKLPYHPFARVKNYGRKFWEAKSKDRYLWSDSGDYSSPWLAFVGYQIHRDGRIRIRKGSIEKEIQKQHDSIAELGREIHFRIKHERKPDIPLGIVHRTLMHLVSFGVGTPSRDYHAPTPNGKSWAKGFKALQKRKVDGSGLRRLDQSRSHVHRLLRLKVRHLRRTGKINYSVPKRTTAENPAFHAGRPYSYYFQFHQTDGVRKPFLQRFKNKIQDRFFRARARIRARIVEAAMNQHLISFTLINRILKVAGLWGMKPSIAERN